MNKQKIPLVEAERIAADVLTLLRPECERIEIAGSVRRKKPEVGDIEIVAIPKMFEQKDMFGNVVERVSALDLFDFSDLGDVIKGGTKYKQIALPECNLDLFIVTPPAQWGVIYMIRTGSAEFSQRMVTRRDRGGRLPSYCKVEGGAVWQGGEIIPMSEEDDYFRLCGMPVVSPPERV